MDDNVWPAVALRFGLVVDGKDLGEFIGVKGLIVENEVFEWVEGGQNAFVHRLPGRTRYKDVTLTRSTDKHSSKLAAWFDEARKDHVMHTAEVTAFDSDETAVAIWSLVDVWPLRYTGPVLDTVLGGLARETLDLAHSGFTMRAG